MTDKRSEILQEMIDYIRANPGSTQYKIQKAIDIPYSTVVNYLKELCIAGHLSFKEEGDSLVRRKRWFLVK